MIFLVSTEEIEIIEYALFLLRKNSFLIRSPVRCAASPPSLCRPAARRPSVCCPALAWTLSPGVADALLSSGLSLHVTSRERPLWSSFLKLLLSYLPLIQNPVCLNLSLPGLLILGDLPSRESRLSRPAHWVWKTIDIFLSNYQLGRILKSEFCSLFHSVLETLKTAESTVIKRVMKKVTWFCPLQPGSPWWRHFHKLDPSLLWTGILSRCVIFPIRIFFYLI